MTKTVSLENIRSGGFGLPTGQIVPGHGSIAVEPEIWAASKDHPVVKAMVDAGALIVDGKGKKAAPSSEDRDENGDTPEMAEMRKRFDASFSALTTELDAEKAKVADLEAQLAAKQAGDGQGGGATSNYSVTEKGAGWFAITHDGKEVTKGLRKDAVEGFDKLSDADKAAFVAANKAD